MKVYGKIILDKQNILAGVLAEAVSDGPADLWRRQVRHRAYRNISDDVLASGLPGKVWLPKSERHIKKLSVQLSVVLRAELIPSKQCHVVGSLCRFKKLAAVRVRLALLQVDVGVAIRVLL